MTDDELERAFVERSPRALEEAYARFAPFFIRIASGALRDAALARDSVHDTLLRLWLAPDSYRRERGALRAFLAVAVRNDALARRRAALRGRTLERRAVADVAPTDDAIAELPDYVAVARLHDALATLPQEQRQVVELAYFHGRSQSEIARELSVPLGTIKSRAALGLRKLASLLAAHRTIS